MIVARFGRITLADAITATNLSLVLARNPAERLTSIT